MLIIVNIIQCVKFNKTFRLLEYQIFNFITITKSKTHYEKINIPLNHSICIYNAIIY
jgi:hypothetical protein